MVARGRPTTKKTSGKGAILKTALGVGKDLLLGGSSGHKCPPGYRYDAKKGQCVKSHRSAKNRLKKAYERRAMRQITSGQLGAARRTLRKKQLIV